FARAVRTSPPVLWFPDRDTIAVAANERGRPYDLVRYALATGAEVGRVRLDAPGAEGPVLAAPDGRTFALGDPRLTSVFDAATGKRTAVVRHNGPVALPTPLGNDLFVVHGNKTVRRID